MKIFTSRLFWGGVLILGGVLFLLENLGVFEGSELFWGICFLVAGMLFLAYFMQNRQEWWALIPGLIMTGIGILLLLLSFFPGIDDAFGGLIILGSLGIGFVLVFLLNRNRWWAIIPGGVLLTLAIISVLENYLPENSVGGFFLIGLGLTFSAVALVPASAGQMRWPWYPAIALIFMGLLVFMTAENTFVYILPVIFLLAGGILIWRALRQR